MMNVEDMREIPGYHGYYVNSSGTAVLKRCRDDLYAVVDGVVCRRKSSTNKWVPVDSDRYFASGGVVWRRMALSVWTAGYLGVGLVPSTPGLPKNQGVHRVVYMTYCGPIPPELEVHHMDHDKTNNCVDNLMLVSRKENIRAYVDAHPRAGTKRCDSCGIKRSYQAVVRSISEGTYCHSCFPPKPRDFSKGVPNYGLRKVERPSKSELSDLIATHSMCAIGRMYGVSDNAVRKWCRSYGLDPKRRPRA